jgi:hypothetical protein
MFIWTWSGEVNAKRIREKYLHATLRQDVSRHLGYAQVVKNMPIPRAKRYSALCPADVFNSCFACSNRAAELASSVSSSRPPRVPPSRS